MTKRKLSRMKKSKVGKVGQHDVTVRGVKTILGNNYVEVKRGKNTAYIPHSAFMQGGQPSTYLREQNLVLTGIHYRSMVQQVDAITDFQPAALLERSGWVEGYFVLPNGTVISPGSRRGPKAIFSLTPAKCAKAGDGPAWRDEVAALVADQTLPAFCIMGAFSSPLLTLTDRSDNAGFEITGEKGTGKSTILRLMASVAGPGADQGQGVYWQTLNTTLAGLETTMQRHRDLPMILDEAGEFMPKEGKSNRAASMVALAFALASGHPKSRWGDPQPTQYRFVYVISSNEAASQTMQGGNHARETAALDRLLSLPVLDGAHGVFDSLPEGFENGTQLSAALDAGMRRHYGRAMPRFLQCLVDERAEDEKALRQKIAALIQQFRDAVHVDEDNGSAVRVCDVFGLVCAAGQLAKGYEVLPDSYDCLAIALEAYRRHLASRDERTAIRKILDLARSDRVIDFYRGESEDITLDDIDDHDGVVYHAKPGTELLLTKDQIKRLFPLVQSFSSSKDLKFPLKHENKRNTVKRSLGSKIKGKRFYCIDIGGLHEE